MKPQISDSAIDQIIADLESLHGVLPSGAQLRRALSARFEGPGGVSRVYRRLGLARARREARPSADRELSAPELATLRGALVQARADAEQMRKRAELAEAREEAHQLRWAQEVDGLRQEILRLKSESRAAPLGWPVEQLRELQWARGRIAELESQLAAAAPSAAAPGA